MWCYVEISSAIFGQLCFGILLVWKNIHFTYGHVCKCCEFANVIENTYQLTNLWKKQRSFFIIGIYDWWHRWNGVVFSTHRMNKQAKLPMQQWWDHWPCKISWFAKSASANTVATIHFTQELSLIHELHVHCTCNICYLKRMEHSVHNILHKLR